MKRMSDPDRFAIAKLISDLTKRISAAEALRVRRSWLCEYGRIYQGTAHQLIETGLVLEQHIPGLGNTNRQQAQFYGTGLQRKAQGDSIDTMSLQVAVLRGRAQRYQVFIPNDSPHTLFLPCSQRKVDRLFPQTKAGSSTTNEEMPRRVQ